MMPRILTLLITLCFTSLAFADCGALITELENKLYNGRKSEMSLCKVWPADQTKTIVVLPMPVSSPDAPDVTLYDLDVLVVATDSQPAEILSFSHEPEALVSDAVRIDDIQIDTARYQLNSQQRAFGVRVDYRGSSSANPFAEQVLSLYVMKGSVLQALFKGLSVEQYGGEWDTRCAGEFNSTKRTLSIGQTVTKGYADLRVNEVSEFWTTKEQGDVCIDESKEMKKTSHSLKYNDKGYDISALK